jgi:hypothetical protein
VSHRATLYAKELRTGPSGELVTKLEKLVLYALADYHQDKLGTNTYPSVSTLAEESLMDERSCRRLLASLEAKGVIQRLRGERQGRSHVTFYRFVELDKAAVENTQKGGLCAPLSSPPFQPKGGQKGGRERTPLDKQEQEQKQIQDPPTPQGGRVVKNCIPIRPDRDDLDQAADAVMQGCDFAARRLRLKIRAVVEQQDAGQKFESSVEIAAAMIDAWTRYTRQGARLRVHMNASKFFEEGYWLNSNSWHWDSDTLRAEKLEMEARVGSWG